MRTCTHPPSGDELPQLITDVPGPRSREMSERLGKVECEGITWRAADGSFPLFWERAFGVNVWDVDGNRFVDATSAFGVATCGHAHPVLTQIAAEQSATLMHGMGDVHPPRTKLELLERLAHLTPGDLGSTILGLNGADAVEAALKLAFLHTGKPGVVAFEGGYHGLLGLSLETVGHPRFRAPFDSLVAERTTWLAYPQAPRWREADSRRATSELDRCLEALQRRLADPNRPAVGAVLVEPIQARGGEVIPPDGFLTGLRQLCDDYDVVLIADEIYTGFGRVGERFACDRHGVVPDVMVLGKALTNGFPLSACLARPEIAASWPASTGEAIHTSTYLGHPVACAVALGAIDLMEALRLPLRSQLGGQRILARLRRNLAGQRGVADVRGQGMLLGVELVDFQTGLPDPGWALRVMLAAMQRGLLVLPSGRAGNVVGLSPPLTTSEIASNFIADMVADCIRDPQRAG